MNPICLYEVGSFMNYEAHVNLVRPYELGTSMRTWDVHAKLGVPFEGKGDEAASAEGKMMRLIWDTQD